MDTCRSGTWAIMLSTLHIGLHIHVSLQVSALCLLLHSLKQENKMRTVTLAQKLVCDRNGNILKCNVDLVGNAT